MTVAAWQSRTRQPPSAVPGALRPHRSPDESPQAGTIHKGRGSSISMVLWYPHSGPFHPAQNRCMGLAGSGPHAEPEHHADSTLYMTCRCPTTR
jgi:hypothetical protein